jgi:hypothetical protein
MSDELANFQLEDEDGTLTEYTAQQLIDAHRGDYGDEGREWADEVITALWEETDYFEENLDDDGDLDREFEELQEPEEEPEAHLPWEAEFTAEMDIKTGRLEKQIGRKLTAGEIQAIVDDVLPQGTSPTWSRPTGRSSPVVRPRAKPRAGT